MSRRNKNVVFICGNMVFCAGESYANGVLCAALLCQTPEPREYLDPKPHLNRALIRCYTKAYNFWGQF